MLGRWRGSWVEQLCFVMSHRLRRLGSGRNEEREEEEVGGEGREVSFFFCFFTYLLSLHRLTKSIRFNISRYIFIIHIHSSFSCFTLLVIILFLLA